MRSILIGCTAVLLAASVFASTDDRSYDGAVHCKAISLLARNAGDAKSKAAIALIDAAIEKEIARGKTRDQAKADIEYARFEWADTTSDKAVFDAEWSKCLKTWGSGS